MFQDEWTGANRNHVNGVGLFEAWPITDATAATSATPLQPPAPPAPPPVSRPWRARLVIAVVVVTVLALVGLVIVLRGSASSRTATVPAAASPAAASPAAPSTPAPVAAPVPGALAANPAAGATVPPSIAPTPAPTAEDRFVDDVQHPPGLSTGLSRGDIVTAGRRLCAAIPGVPSHPVLIGLLTKASFDPRVVEVFLTAAEKDLCPQETYGRPAVP